MEFDRRNGIWLTELTIPIPFNSIRNRNPAIKHPFFLFVINQSADSLHPTDPLNATHKVRGDSGILKSTLPWSLRVCAVVSSRHEPGVSTDTASSPFWVGVRFGQASFSISEVESRSFSITPLFHASPTPVCRLLRRSPPLPRLSYAGELPSFSFHAASLDAIAAPPPLRSPPRSLRRNYLMHPSPDANKKRSTKRVAEDEVIISQDSDHPCMFTRQRRGTRNNAINQDRKLDSGKVYSYLENLWLSFPEDKKRSFTHLDPLWYTLYSEDSNKEKVLNWIKRKDIFSRKYVFFPIVLWGHWSLLIFCHFGESLESKSRTPCILLLDSLEMTDHSKQLEPVIRKFVLDIYRSLERTEDIGLLRKMPFLIPKVPQQRDDTECGYLVLYYIKLFVESAPESFSIYDGYPYFMKKDWFDSRGLDGFCKTLDSSLK